MKVLLVKHPSPVIGTSIYTLGKWYDCMIFSKTLYKDNTEEIFYIIKCDDNRERGISADYFMTQEEFRQNKLNELGI